MANIPLKSIKFPDLDDTYTVPSNAGELPYNKSATYPDDTVGKALQDKPDADGTIANAEQLTSNIYEEDNTPYNFRTSGGSIDIGDRETDMLVGGTVAWNQLVPDTGSGLSVTVTNGHKYYMNKGGTKSIGSSSGSAITGLTGGTDNVIDLTAMFGSTIADYIYSLEQATAGAGVAFFRKYFPNSYYPYNAGELVSVSGLSAHKTVGFNLLDGQFEFGNIDSSGADSGSDHHYIRSIGYMDALPNTKYCCYAYDTERPVLQMYRLEYDVNKNLLTREQIWSNNTATNPKHFVFTTLADTRYIRYFAYSTTEWSSVDNLKICINLSWDGSRDGEYEEYKEHTYPLDDSLTLRGIPKLDANNNLYYDGDTYESDGTVTRKYGVVDLGTLTWVYTSYGDGYFYASVPTIKLAGSWSAIPNVVCPKYLTGSGNDVGNANDKDKVVSVPPNQAQVIIKDKAYTDAASFKTAMSGVYLVYELATPTTETADPYTNPQIVNDFGTEEFTTDTVVPVGHVTHYPVNLVAKLEMMPNSPDGNGDYIVQQASGINTYIPLASTDTITNIIARLEALEGGGE